MRDLIILLVHLWVANSVRNRDKFDLHVTRAGIICDVAPIACVSWAADARPCCVGMDVERRRADPLASVFALQAVRG